MGQSNAIFAAIVIAYVVFITAKGELPAYIQILRGGDAATPGASGSFSGIQNTLIGALPSSVNGIPIIVQQSSQASELGTDSAGLSAATSGILSLGAI